MSDEWQYETMVEQAYQDREYIRELEAEVEDWRDGAHHAATEECGDGRHCTCVPALRAKLNKVEEVVKAARVLRVAGDRPFSEQSDLDTETHLVIEAVVVFDEENGDV